jgi:hypothetical protein
MLPPHFGFMLGIAGSKPPFSPILGDNPTFNYILVQAYQEISHLCLIQILFQEGPCLELCFSFC